ncbi:MULTISPECIES: hypothetical protein [unclassified Mycobacteroides]|nr:MULTISPECIES: hypothetical protein [unclassified Mycobacteroides]
MRSITHTRSWDWVWNRVGGTRKRFPYRRLAQNADALHPEPIQRER